MRGSTAGLPQSLGSVTGDGLSGISDKPNPSYRLLGVLDIVFACCVVCPCVVAYWRSVWALMEIYVFPEDQLVSALISTAIGVGGHMFFSLTQNWFKQLFHPDRNVLVYYVGSRLYTECFAIACVNSWRGPWLLIDIHTRKQCFTVLATTMVGVVALISVRGLRNVTAPPFIIVRDNIREYFDVITMFRLTPDKSFGLFALDCLFSIVVIGTLVVFVWRGSWVLVDILLYPEDAVRSAWGSVIIGYIAAAVMFLLQPIAKLLCDKGSGTSRLFVADLVNLLALFGTVNVWRGIWTLLDIYFIPESPELSCWLSHAISFALLILMGCANSLLVRGVYIDAEEPDGKCVEFPCYYFRVMFQRKQLRKRLNYSVGKGSYSTYEEKPPEKTITISGIHNIIVENSGTG